MLAEFLLTPDALADDDGRNGTDVVREITDCLFPSRAVPVALVCKLGGDKWEIAASRRIARIENRNHRDAAMSFFKRLVSEYCAVRPPIQMQSEDENAWFNAGLTSASNVPMERIVVSAKFNLPSTMGVSLKTFVSDGFWANYENPRLVGRDTASQEQVLRAICTHSEWLLLRLPQIRGGSDDEIVTVKQIIRMSNQQLPAGFSKSFIDLHLCLSGNLTEQQLIRSVSSELSSFVRTGVKIQLTIWPKAHFANREILGGDYTKTSPGDLLQRSIWYITMNHVAVGSRRAANAGDAGNAWSLFSRQKAHERSEGIKSETPLRVEVLT
jgi:hypothetical protein